MRKLHFKSGENGIHSTVVRASDTVYAIVTNATETAETVTIPTDATVVYFTADGDFWADFQGNTAVKPTVDDVDGSASMLNPVAIELFNIGTTFSLVSDTTAVRTISMTFYS